MQHTAPSSTGYQTAQHLAPSLWPSAHWQVGGTSGVGQCSTSHEISCPFLSWGQGLFPGHMACSAHWSTGTLDSQHREPGEESPHVSPYPLFYISGAQIWCTPEGFSFPSQSILLPSETGWSSPGPATTFWKGVGVLFPLSITMASLC